ncbi:hypothetical protein HPP92_014323 [Vanilla planifolia]|uniref:Tetraspanin-19 n=1 Tax=Vanilla planifolia TaxID=51239 RepID=A0A835UUN0_VANPL|nr:hypothetical protein HPP92_014323 [Vanilla planifolia]
MDAWARACLQSSLKIVNSVIGLLGMAMIMYALWMIRVWFRETSGLSPGISGSSPQWFIFTFLGLGIFLCVITCTGHIAAEAINGHCLSCYIAFVFLLLVVEAVIAADIFLNSDWEKDFPRDPTGRFDEFKNFIKSNFQICEWAGFLAVAAQAMSIFLAMVLRALGPDYGVYYDSDDESEPPRLPLLRKHVHNTPFTANANLLLKNDSWSIRIHNKITGKN